MSELPFRQAVPDDPRVAAHATSASPAWLWSTDGSRILWANPNGAAAFDAPSAGVLVARRFDPHEPTAAQVARIARTLPSGTARLERLRGFGAGFGHTLLCRSSRILLAEQTRAILIVAAEPIGPVLPLAERARRLLAEEPGALAVFAPDGTLLFANAPGSTILGSATSLAAIGGDAVADRAISAGQAEGSTAIASLVIRRLGAGADTVLAVALTPTPQTGVSAMAAATGPSSVSAPPEPARPEPAAPGSAAPHPSTTPSAAEPPTPANNDAAREAVAPAYESPATAAAPPVPPPEVVASNAERRHPLRFVWQMDPEGRFTLGSDEFSAVIGPGVAVTLGRPWREVAAALGLDPDGQVERAVATRDTWSGIAVAWPVDGSDDRLRVELAGLPIYDRNRVFLGYRGFGVCRDVERINALAKLRRSSPDAAGAPVAAPPSPPDTGASAAPAVDPCSAAAPRPDEPRHPPFTAVAATPNVVPFRAMAEARNSALSPVERNAFGEIARQLTARLRGESGATIGGAAPIADTDPPLADEPALPSRSEQDGAAAIVASGRGQADDAFDVDSVRRLLDRLPIGILIYRQNLVIHANRTFLAWTGYRDLEALAAAGGLDSLFAEPGESDADETGGPGRSITIAAISGDRIPVEGRLFSVAWSGAPALMLVLADADGHRSAADVALRLAQAECKELHAILETTTDGVVVVDRDARILSANGRAEALFGRAPGALTGTRLTELLAAESRSGALQSLETAPRNTAAGTPEQREVAGLAGENRPVPLLMAVGRIAESPDKLAVVLRDITAWKNAERELVAERRRAEKCSTAEADFLTKISHEIRTPLNSIIGFSEVMIDERFGPIGNERYRDYLKDIRASGNHVVSLLDDLLDLSKIESGKLELRFAAVQLNDMVRNCVALIQPQANRQRIIIRTSLQPSLRPVLADPRAVRQIVLNLLSNSLKLTAAGGQVIVSTALSDGGDAILHVRDTGSGMSQGALAAVLEPFRQPAIAPRNGSADTGLGLPLTKALAEANHAGFAISSKIGDGTLVEIVFPAARVAAD